MVLSRKWHLARLAFLAVFGVSLLAPETAASPVLEDSRTRNHKSMSLQQPRTPVGSPTNWLERSSTKSAREAVYSNVQTNSRARKTKDLASSLTVEVDESSNRDSDSGSSTPQPVTPSLKSEVKNLLAKAKKRVTFQEGNMREDGVIGVHEDVIEVPSRRQLHDESETKYYDKKRGKALRMRKNRKVLAAIAKNLEKDGKKLRSRKKVGFMTLRQTLNKDESVLAAYSEHRIIARMCDENSIPDYKKTADGTLIDLAFRKKLFLTFKKAMIPTNKSFPMVLASMLRVWSMENVDDVNSLEEVYDLYLKLLEPLSLTGQLDSVLNQFAVFAVQNELTDVLYDPSTFNLIKPAMDEVAFFFNEVPESASISDDKSEKIFQLVDPLAEDDLKLSPQSLKYVINQVYAAKKELRKRLFDILRFEIKVRNDAVLLETFNDVGVISGRPVDRVSFWRMGDYINDQATHTRDRIRAMIVEHRAKPVGSILLLESIYKISLSGMSRIIMPRARANAFIRMHANWYISEGSIVQELEQLTKSIAGQKDDVEYKRAMVLVEKDLWRLQLTTAFLLRMATCVDTEIRLSIPANEDGYSIDIFHGKLATRMLALAQTLDLASNFTQAIFS